MACTKNLRTDLNPTADSGGVWTYVGYNSMSSTGPWNNTPAENMTGLSPNTQMSGDNPSIDPSLGSTGFYRFTYAVTNDFCTDVNTITVEIKPVSCPGEDDSITVCSNDAQFSLANAFVASSSCDVLIGTVTGVSGSPTFGSAPNYNFNPSTNGAGVYVIRNSTAVSPSPGFTLDCVDCAAEADITVTVNQFRSPGDERFVPYLSICIDPDCSTNLRDTLLNLPVGSDNGSWYLRAASPGYPSYASALLTVTSTSLGTVTSSFSPDTLLSSGDVDCIVDFSDADQGNVYAFEYVLDPGGPCEVSQSVDIYVGPIPSAGTPPGPETVCLIDFITTLGGEVMNLWDQLTGSPSTQGTWEVTQNGGANMAAALTTAYDAGNTSPLFLFSGQDDEIDFGILRDNGGSSGGPVSAGTTVTFTFEYTAQLPSQYLCANCEEQTSTYTKTIIFNHRTGSTVYNTSPSAYACVNGCTINLLSLMTGTIDPGATWRMWSIGGITDLIRIDPNFGAESPANYSFGANLSFSTVDQPGSDLTLDFSLVPAGTYQFRLLGGSAPCEQFTDLFITVTQPAPECTVEVTISAT